MKKTILRVQNYFINKILIGDYKVIKIEQYTMKIEIDELYKFCIWIANGKGHVKTYNGMYNYMALKFSNQQEIWSVLSPIIREHNKKYELVEIEKEIRELKERQREIKLRTKN